MKKRLIGSLLFGALVASTGTFVSCTNYDDDFADLRSEIKAQQDLIAQLQDKVKNGDVIQSVTPISGGILVTLSDGSTYSIVNGQNGLDGKDGLNGKDGLDGKDGQDGLNGKDGQDGKDGVDGQNGVVWEIDAETGYWKRDGVLTEYKAVGIDGTSAVAPTIDIVDGYWVINGQNTGVKAVGVDGKDGQNGQDGKDGQDGKNGVDGKDGQDGKNGVDGKDGQDGKNGVDGKDGKDGQDGKDGLTPTVEINAEGYWVINGVTSNVKAQGRDGVDGKNGQNGKDGLPGLTGDAGQNGQNGYYYVPNTETGCFDIYMDGVKIAETEIGYMATGAVTAVLDQQNLSVYGLNAGDVQVCLAGYLRSLVFKPYLYLDGIETIEYPYISDSVLQLLPQAPQVQRTRDDVKQTISNGKSKYSGDRVEFKNWVADQYPNQPKDFYRTPVEGWFFYPTIGVEYHMNPANADVEYSDVAGYSVLSPDVLYFNTRAIPSGVTVTSPEKGFAAWGKYTGSKFATSNKGIVTAGLKVTGAEKINYYPTDNADNQNDITVALQINSKTSDGKADPITSDYALIKPTKIWLEGLVWTKNPTYKKGGKTRTGDELGMIDQKKVHVWDSPEEAIMDEDGAALELYWNDEDGINISEWLGIHYVYEDLKTRKWKTGTWKFGQETPWGLHYEFNLVDYFIDTNKTRDSRYADWGPINGKTAAAQNKGQLVARNVKASGDNDWEGYTIEEQSETSVDREPLVQVLVKSADGKVIMDGYILVHISGTPDVEPDNIEIANLPLEDVKHFDLCDSEDDWVFEVDWAEFSDYGLTQTLNNMTKEYFDANYEADIKQANVETTATGDEVDYLYIYKKFTKNGNDTPENMTVDRLGTVKYYPNWLGTTNHRIQWYLSTEEWEELTHDQNLPRTEVRYVRFKEKDGVSPRPKYPYVYVKMTLRVDRKINADKFGTKNKNYWFDLNGKDGQLLSKSSDMQAVIYDIREPRDFFYANEFSGRIRSTLLAINGVNIENTGGKATAANPAHKYYFLPEVRTINTQYGTYTLTPQSSAADKDWNQMYCMYLNDVHKYTNVDAMKKLLDACAINVGKGMFNNVSYYAVKGGSYTKIASLNPETGVITLINNDATKAVLNAVGYVMPEYDADMKKLKQANILTELTAWLGIIANNGCDVAVKVNEGEMLTSWQRPINLDETKIKVAVDANTNGNTIYLIDYLKLFDWRGPNAGYMWGNQTWFWAYYMVKSITVDMTPANVKTNMHSNTMQPLSTITTQAHLTNLNGSNGAVTYNFWNAISGFNSAAKNDDIVKLMKNSKELFGGFYYENNGDNVQEFDVEIPITIEYEWGKFKQTVTWHIDRTILH